MAVPLANLEVQLLICNYGGLTLLRNQLLEVGGFLSEGDLPKSAFLQSRQLHIGHQRRSHPIALGFCCDAVLLADGYQLGAEGAGVKGLQHILVGFGGSGDCPTAHIKITTAEGSARNRLLEKFASLEDASK